MNQSIVFIDRRVNNYETLVVSLDAAIPWYLLSSEQDGIAQMQRILAGYSGLDSIHVVSHGSPGAIYLGSTVLNADNLANYASQLQEIGGSLNQTGDILLYGCNVAQGELGSQFIKSLAELTEADVAASTDETGPNGNWILELNSGSIVAATFDGSASLLLLQTIIGTEGNDTLAGDGLDNTIYGLGGNDSIDGESASDWIDGGLAGR